jgi:hypothetical protein
MTCRARARGDVGGQDARVRGRSVLVLEILDDRARLGERDRAVDERRHARRQRQVDEGSLALRAAL